MNTDASSLLEAGEAVAAEFRRHWIAPVRALIVLGALGAVPFSVWAFFAVTAPSTPYVERMVLFVSILWLFIFWIALFAAWTHYWLARWYVTDRRILGITHRWLFTRSASAIALSKVAAVSIRTEGLMQPTLHFGDVVIEGDAGEQIVARDIPSPAAMQKAIQEATMHTGEILEESERQRQALKLVAHEVKGYLARNVAFLSGVVSGDFGAVPDTMKGFADRALSGTREGVSALKDILESQSQGGALALHIERFDLREDVRAVVERATPAAQAKGLTLELAEHPQPCMVNGDREKLRERVLRNLIDNAINYTPGGRVMAGTTELEGAIVFWVEDTGVGISPGDMSKLFTEGGHGEHSQEINPHSTGFGLFAAKQVVEAHGGRIWAESEGQGHGSRFYVLLPAADMQLAQQPESR